ncbi:MAG: M48 family metallopeptidase [Vampirovibrionales bacterium]
MKTPDSLKACINPKETLYFWIAVIATLAVVCWILGSITLLGAVLGTTLKETLQNDVDPSVTLMVIVSYVVFYVAMIGIALFIGQGLFVGWLEGNAVKISPQQFPEIDARGTVLAEKIGLKKRPNMYVLQEGGFLNAFATRFFAKDYAVFYSEVIELAYQEGEEALDFIIAHEFAHIQRNHVLKRFLLFIGLLMPFLGKAYYRACEYTCDAMAAFVAPQGAIKGLTLLAVGKHLHKRMLPDVMVRQAEDEAGVWCWLAEIVSTHPHLYKRIQRLLMWHL